MGSKDLPLPLGNVFKRPQRRGIIHGNHVLDESIVEVITVSHSPPAFRLETATQKENVSHPCSNRAHSVLYVLIK